MSELIDKVCGICGGQLETGNHGGYVHADDADDADGHAPVAVRPR